MATPLGHAGSANITLPVYNASATTITRGMVVAHNSIAASNPAAQFLDLTQNKDYGSGTVRQLDLPMIPVKAGIVDTTTVGGSSNLGIAMADILPGQSGLVVTYGLAKVIPNGAITVGEVIAPAASGQVLDAANATHKNPCGVMVETGASGVLAWAFVNFMNWLGAAGTSVAGKAY